MAATPADGALCEAELELLTRMHRYHEWAALYKARALHEATAVFRLRIPLLRLGPSCTCADLLAVMQMLRHDSLIRCLDLTNVPLGDVGACVVADGLAAGAPLREVILTNCGIGEAGACALLGALLKNMHVRRVSLASNFLGSAAGAQALAAVLLRTRYLEEVDVRFCALGSAGLREVAAALLQRATARESWREGRRGGSSSSGGGGGGGGRRLEGESWAWLFGGLAKADRLVVTGAFQVKLKGEAPSSPPASSPDSSGGVVATTPTMPTSFLVGGAAPVASACAASAAPAGAAAAAAVAAATGRAAKPAAPPAAAATAAAAAAPATPSRPRAVSSTNPTAHPAPEEDTLDIIVHIGGNLVRLEVLASLTHGVGLALTLVGACFLFAKPRSPATASLELASYIVYMGGLGAWFLTALLRHSLFQLNYSIFQRLIPPAGFALVACTYTPFLLNAYACVSGAWVLLGLQWAMAGVGGLLGSYYSARHTARALSRAVVLLYLLQGYSGGLVGLLLPQCLPQGAWRLLLPGGALFTLGVYFYSREKPIGGISADKAAWYCVIIIAALLHFLAVYWYVAPPSQACYEAAARLGLAAGQAPGALPQQRGGGGGAAPGALPPHWEGLAEAMRAAKEMMSESAERLSEVSTAGKRAVVERLVGMLRDVIAQLEGGGGGARGGEL